MISKILLFALFIILIYNQLQSKTFSNTNDSIYPLVHSCDTSELWKHFYLFENIKISSYYELIDSVSINASKNNIYKILVLSPITQEDIDVLPCDTNECKRLLVVLKKEKDSIFKIENINENIILNNFYYQSDPYEPGIKVSGKKFTLHFYFGSIIRCYYNLSFEVTLKDIFLSKLDYDCYVNVDLENNTQKTIKFKKKSKYLLKNIKTEDLIDIPDLLEKYKDEMDK